MTPFQHRQIELMRQMEKSLLLDSSTSQIVSIQSDYTSDNKLCLTTVSFMNPELADSIYTQIIEPLKAIDPDQYYFPKSSLHVTIHNIRVVNKPLTYTNADIDLALHILRSEIPTYRSPKFALRELLSLPTSIAIIALIDPSYDQMVRSIRKHFADAGLADDKKYFTDEKIFANVTICRYTKSPSKLFLETVQKNNEKTFGIFSPKETTLVTSNAGMHPSKTTIIESFAFRNI